MVEFMRTLLRRNPEVLASFFSQPFARFGIQSLEPSVQGILSLGLIFFELNGLSGG